MIPNMTLSGVLPPYVAGFPDGGPQSMAPYATTMKEIADTLCGTPHRVKLLDGLLNLRRELRTKGLYGVQWLDGSFCENIEMAEGRSPGDIDVVSLLVRPATIKTQADWVAFHAANQHMFDRKSAKANFGCDAFYVEAHFPALWVENQITYWFGLFSHKRDTHLWKGMLKVILNQDDADDLLARAKLAAVATGP
jgi:hypothetical protein